VGVSAAIFLGCIGFAKVQLAQVWAFIPAYQSALVVCDLVTAALIFGQARIARSAALMALGAAYLFAACLAVVHAASFPGLFAPGGLIGGAQTTAWLYMFWHGGFPLLVIGYALLKGAPPLRAEPSRVLAITVASIVAASLAIAWLAAAGEAVLPAVMQGDRYTPAMIFVVSTVWLLTLASLIVLWRRRPFTVLQLWLMVVLCAWLFDVGLAAVFNGGRFDVGFYAGRIYGLAAASFVLLVLLMENAALHASLARSLGRHGDRLKTLAAIDQAIIAGQSADQIAASVIQPLRELLDVPRAIVNRFDLAAGQVEWVAAAGRRRTHVGAGVRYSLALMGDESALRRGEPQFIDVHGAGNRGAARVRRALVHRRADDRRRRVDRRDQLRRRGRRVQHRAGQHRAGGRGAARHRDCAIAAPRSGEGARRRARRKGDGAHGSPASGQQGAGELQLFRVA
jgi:hypothetical protein